MKAKQQSVTDALQRIGKLADFDLKPIVPAPKEYHYRRRIRLQVGRNNMPRPTPKPNPELRPIRERILNEKYADEEARDFDNVAQLRAMAS